jgi:hypothetical protein
LWHFGLQTFSQQTGVQQGFSQHFGAQQGFSQHFGAQHGASQHFGAQQRTFSQRTLRHFGAQQHGSGQHFGAAQHSGSQQLPLASNRSLMLQNKSRTGVGRQTRHLPQAGSQAGAQAGAHGFAQHGWQQGATLAQALHSPQPPPFSPSMRSKSSKPNPWLHRATLTRSAPKIILLLIEQPLLYSELGLESLTRSSYGVLRQGRRTIPWLDSHPIRLPDAPSRRTTRHAQFAKGQLRYRPRREERLNERKTFLANDLLILLRKDFHTRKLVKVCRL